MWKRTIIHYNLTVINHDIVSRGLTTYTVISSDETTTAMTMNEVKRFSGKLVIEPFVRIRLHVAVVVIFLQ